MPDATEPSSPTGSGESPSSGGTDLRILPVHVLDLGKAKSGDIRDLTKGRGKLLDEVTDTLLELAATADDQSTSKTLVPVVMVVERTRKRKSIF